MTINLVELELAVSQLTPQQLADFRVWFSEYDARQWDQQLAADAAAGRLDNLADEALQDYQAGRTRPL